MSAGRKPNPLGSSNAKVLDFRTRVVAHRAEPGQPVELAPELPKEPDWEQFFPRPERRRALAELDGQTRRAADTPEALDAQLRRCRFVAHETWTLIVSDLGDRSGLLARVDRLALQVLCVTMARLDQAERDISVSGAMHRGRDGGVVKNPAVSMARQHREQFNRMLPEFGLSPSARMRLKQVDWVTDDGDGLFD